MVEIIFVFVIKADADKGYLCWFYISLLILHHLYLVSKDELHVK